MKKKLLAVSTAALFLTAAPLHAGTVAVDKDYMTKFNVDGVFVSPSLYECQTAVRKKAIADESVERAGENIACHLETLSPNAKMNRSGTIVVQTSKEKEGVALTLVLKPAIKVNNSEMKIEWSCGASPQEALKFVPEECNHLVDPQQALADEQKETQRTLNHAIVWGDTAEFERLLASGVDINKSWRLDGDSPLITAIRHKQDGMVKLLLSKGANVNAAGASGTTPLMRAVKNENIDLVKTLIERGADVRAQDAFDFPVAKSGSTALHAIAGSKDAEKSIAIATLLLQKGADINAGNEAEATPLHVAAARGTQQLAAFLLRKGATLNAKTKTGVTPLLMALRGNQKDVADYLIAQGAEFVNGADLMSEASLAARHGYPDIFKLALAKGSDAKAKDKNGDSLLHIVTASGNLEIAKILIERGVDVAQLDNAGRAPLHYAVKMGHGDLVALLLDKGADINAKAADKGETPLYFAVEEKNKEIAEILIKRGANVNPTGKDLDTPLHLAAEAGSLELVKLLVESGADINADGKEGKGLTPLVSAINRKDFNEALIKYLLDKGAATQKVAIFFEQKKDDPLRLEVSLPAIAVALFEARGTKRSALVNLLIEHGAAPQTAMLFKGYFKGKLYQKTEIAPLHFAAAHGDSATVELLLKHGANANTKFIGVFRPKVLPQEKLDEVAASFAKVGDGINYVSDQQNGWTPLHFASAAGNLDTVKVLLAHSANSALRDAHGKKAADYVSAENSEIAKLLASKKGKARD